MMSTQRDDPFRGSGEEHVSDLKLERFLLGELDPAETAKVAEALERDESLRERRMRLERSNEEILGSYPASMMVSEIRRKLGDANRDSRRYDTGPAGDATRNGWRRFWPIPALSLAAAAVVVLLLLPPAAEWFDGGPETTLDTRIKGLDPQLRLFRKTEAGSEQLDTGSLAREGDRILIQYDAAGEAFGFIFSVDGRGAVTRHRPEAGSTSLPLRQGGAVSLDFSYELDDAPRWEKFYFITSDDPFRVDVVLGAVENMLGSTAPARGDTLGLPSGLRQTIFTLRKEGNHE
jgi:hypothetical protein